MKAIKNTIYTLGFCVAIISAFWALGYDNTVIHPKLSRAGIEIYGKNADVKLTQEQASWIIEGSIAEDTDPRYLNHFYDPTTGKGLSDGMFSGKPVKEWAQKQDSLTGDYSEMAIMGNYRQGDYKRAYQGIGHILHLAQDMSVPAHTRNDAHPEGDPYEKWAEQNGDVNSNNASFIKIDNLNQVFDELANYSHYNFFSEDTIKIDNIKDYKIVEEKNDNKIIKYLTINNDAQSYKLCVLDNILIQSTCRIGKDDKYYQVHLDYWNLLYPKAIGYSAGVIDYFVEQFKQIDRQKQEKEKLSLWSKTKSFFSELGSDTKYVLGDSVISVRINAPIIWNNTKSAVKEALPGKRVDPMASVANIGQIASNSSVIPAPPSVIPVQTGIQTQDTDSSPMAQNDNATVIIPVRQQADDTPAGIQTQNSLDSRLTEPFGQASLHGDDKKEYENNNPIHAPYQRPAGVIHAPYQRSAVVASSNASESSSITNQFQGQFNGYVAPAVIVNETNQPQSADSSPTAQNPSVPARADDTVGEEAAPEAPQKESQDQIDGGSTSGDLEVESLAESETQELPIDQNSAEDSSPATQNDEEESAQNDAQSEQVADETSQSEPQSEPEPEPEPEPQPTTPDIQFYLTNYNVRQMNFTLNWQDANNIIQNWELEYKLGPNFGWIDLANSSSLIAGSYQFTAQYDDLTYYFRLRGSGASGNYTEWQVLQADISTNPVVINEIAWMGTKASTDDEWIELTNKTDQEIDLTGWTLSESDGTPEIILTGKIAPNGFYLLERTDDTTVANVAADQIYTGALNNPQSSSDYGNDLILSDADGNVIDQTKTAYNGVNNSNSKMSSERVSIWADSNNRDNWQYYWNSYLTVPADAKDAGGNTISGTPKSRNSWADRFFSISTDIAKNTTLLEDRGTVKVINNINISGEAILNIEPGTVLKFGGAQSGFNVASGSISAKGTTDNKIVFTSSNDNTYGIQTGYSSPLYGDWGKINFDENTTGEFDNIIFRYSGNGTATPSIKAYKATLKIFNSYFDNNKYDVLSVEDSDIDIAYNTFKNNNYNGIAITEGTSTITGNTFDWLANPGVGIYIKSQKGTINISNNQFASMYAPITLDYFGNFTIQDNQASGNGYNGIIINSPSGYSYDEEIYLDSNMVYVVPNFIYYAGPKLKVAPGTIIKFAGALYVQGDFEAIGTADNPITFTRIGDNTVGGDSGSGYSSAPSYWRAFQISGAANVAMDYFTIKHGGNGWNYVSEQIDGKCLKVFNGVQNLTFINSTMTWCGRGLYSYTESAQIENSVFSYNSFNLESYAQTGHISNTTFGNTLVESLVLSDYQQVSY